MASFDLNGVTITESRRERINRLALRFGAMVGDDGQITLETEGSRPDAMNRFRAGVDRYRLHAGDLAEEGAVLFRR